MKNLHDLSLPQQELVRISNILHSLLFGSRFGTVRLGHYSTSINVYICLHYHSESLDLLVHKLILVLLAFHRRIQLIK